MAGNTRDILQQYLYYFGVWEPDMTAFIRRVLAFGDVFIDVGANIGYFSLLAARCVSRSGRVVSIEASPRIYADLVANVSRNRRSNIRTLNLAAADKPGRVSIFPGPDGNCGASTILANGVNVEREAEVVAVAIDDILTTEEADSAKLIKIDVEGAEVAVIAGMKQLITSGRLDRKFLVEVHAEALAAQGLSPSDVIAPFDRAGYQTFVLDNDYDTWRYLYPGSARKPRPLQEPIQWDANLLFSRTDPRKV